MFHNPINILILCGILSAIFATKVGKAIEQIKLQTHIHVNQISSFEKDESYRDI